MGNPAKPPLLSGETTARFAFPCRDFGACPGTIHSLYAGACMHKLSRESWIQAGFKTLDSLGYIHLSAEKIARQLNVTRGSFYHHFRNRSDFVDA
ncbi:MAG TPA: TetR/AcrR family transcriptional regulator, partial [Hydrogenophaga sp.]|nr:TetR/AcrR family transcriptional regulator [Hydrogenophaga sp.]